MRECPVFLVFPYHIYMMADNSRCFQSKFRGSLIFLLFPYFLINSSAFAPIYTAGTSKAVTKPLE